MSKAANESLNAAFDIEYISGSISSNIRSSVSNEITIHNPEFAAPVQFEPVEHVAEDEDFEEVRGNLKSLVRKGNKMLDNLIDVAESSERDRTYEVAGQVLKHLADINKDIIATRKTHKEIKQLKKNENDGGSVNIDKAVFVGTTAELLKQVKAEQEKK
jgi:hypothetical protein